MFFSEYLESEERAVVEMHSVDGGDARFYNGLWDIGEDEWTGP